MRMTKIISVIIAAALVFGSVYTTNAAEKLKYIWNNSPDGVKEYIDEQTKMYYQYVEENGGITIYYACPDDKKTHTVIEFPSDIDGMPVTKIGNRACLGDLEGTKKVVFPNSVKEIGVENFVEIKSLEEVDFGNNLEKIGDDSFSYCNNLASFTLPYTLTDIGDMAFMNCGVESVTIPESMKKIRNCFAGCYALEKINIPDGVTSIDGFMDCRSLKSVKIPSSVTKMENAFYNCTNLENVEWEPSNITDMGYNTFRGTKYIENYPSEFLLINNNKALWQYLGDKEECRVPDGVEKICGWAFSQGEYGKEKSTIRKIILPDSVTTLEASSFNHARLLEAVDFGKNITVIPNCAFLGTAIEEITILDGVISLGDGAFSECKSLKKIVLPDTIESIGNECFAGCSALTEIVLPDSLKKIGTKVFNECNSLKRLNIPEGISNKVNKDTFYASSVTTVDYNGKITNGIYESMPKNVWENSVETDSDFVIIDGVLKSYVGNDKNIKIPEGVKEISKRAFAEKDFDTVTFPSTLEKIGMLAFYASPIKEVTIPSNVRIVGEMSFAQCPNLKKIVIENGVKQVDGLAFAYCNLLDDVTIGEGVRTAKNAFDDTPYRYSVSADEYNSPTWEAPTGIVPMPTPKPSASPTPTATPSIEPSSAPTLTVTSSNGGLNVTVNEKPVVFTDAKPFIDEHDRTQIPVRAVSEMLGCDVEWDGANRTVTVNHGDDVIRLVIGSDVMYVNRSAVKMDTQAVIKDDRTYVPIRYIGEMTGCEVVYSAK